ncbi:hypothetical protein, partial [uncultured Bacteroides sp.]|uniref:hypothetical protein n=1 Tax=uncultured Bacteroides sp. TaxID=162156 RepID=UPI00258395F3
NILPVQKTTISLRLLNERLKNTIQVFFLLFFNAHRTKIKKVFNEVNIIGSNKLTSCRQQVN